MVDIERREKLLNYLKSIGCDIEYAIMMEEIPEFGYENKKVVISIDKKVMTMEQFDDFSDAWCKIVEPRINGEEK